MKTFNKTIISILVLIYTILLFCNNNIKAEDSSKKILDDFNNLDNWQIFKSEEAEIGLVTDEGFKGNCMRLNFDFTKRKGYIVASKEVSFSLPKDYKFIFYIRGISEDNNLEFKLIDEKGNTYWKKWENFKFSKDWRKVVLSKRNVAFGWGPVPGTELKEVRKIEFAISCGEGGKGSVWIDDLTFIGFEKAVLDIRKVEVEASSFEDDGHRPEKAIDGWLETYWMSKSTSEPQWIEIDLGKVEELIGLMLYWGESYAKAYEILSSKDGENWKPIYATTNSDGEIDDIYFIKIKGRFIKLVNKISSLGRGYALRKIVIRGADEEILTTASSSKDSKRTQNAIDGRMDTVWHSEDKNNQWIKIDFREQKEIGGLFIHWDKAYATAYDIAISDDNKEWFIIYTENEGNGGMDKACFEETQTRFVKLILKEGIAKEGFGIKEIEIKAPEEIDVLKRYYETVARYSPKGYYPRWLTGEQSYWTVVGARDDENEVLLCEDGTIEPYKRGFSLMPFLYMDGKLITREDAKITQFLERDYLPIPSVKWEYNGVTFTLKLFAYGKAGESVAYAWYTVENNRKESVSGKLFLTMRPFQVYPPWPPCQKEGGFSNLYDISYKDDVIEVNNNYKIYPLTKPDGFGAQPGLIKIDNLPEGDVVNIIQSGALPPEKDLSGNADWNRSDWNASAAMEYSFKLNPADAQDYFVAIPLYNKNLDLIDMKGNQIKPRIEKMLEETINFWEAELSKVEIDIPKVEILNILKSNIAYNLITKDGPGFQPGSRNYDKSWIRDGGIQGTALLKFGFTEEMREFIDWYVGYQYETGEIPPIIRPTEGPEPVDEYDSQGEFVFAVLQYYLFTKDKEWLEGKLPNVVKALEYLVYLRNQRLTSEYEKTPEKRVFYGILPDSISHEGYVPPVHSYWDNFWALEGWKAGRDIAKTLDRDDLVQWAEDEYQSLKKSFYESLNLAMKQKNIDYIPGCVEKGDHDAAATAAAIIYCDELENMPRLQLKNTFDKYYLTLQRRMASSSRYIFGPYELRTATAFIYMGQRERALNVLRFMLRHRQPLAWNQWAEVIDTDSRAPFYLGDMPHTWVGAEYINAIRSLFVYELDNRLILAHGVDEIWLKDGISAKNMPTYYGNISYSLEKQEGILKAKFWGEAISPPGGFVFKIPSANKIKRIKLNGEIFEGFLGKEVVLRELPIEVTIYYRD